MSFHHLTLLRSFLFWLAANHMDDMLGTLLDLDDSVRVIMDWIDENGGFEKNTLVRFIVLQHRMYLVVCWCWSAVPFLISLPFLPNTFSMSLPTTTTI
jgi:hypothetical protein